MYCYQTEGYPGKREAITALASCRHFFTSTFRVEKEGLIEVKLCFIGTICLVSVCRHWVLFCLSLLKSSSLSGIVFSWMYLHINQITSQSSFWEAKQIDLAQTYTVRHFLQPLNNFCSFFFYSRGYFPEDHPSPPIFLFPFLPGFLAASLVAKSQRQFLQQCLHALTLRSFPTLLLSMLWSPILPGQPAVVVATCIILYSTTL